MEIADVVAPRSEDPKLNIRVINFELYLRSELVHASVTNLLEGIIINWYLSIVDMIYENIIFIEWFQSS